MDSTQSRGDQTVLDVDELVERCLGHFGFLQRMLVKFQQHFEDGLRLLERGVESQDAQEIAQVAHRLKGAAANMAAAELQRRAADVETLGRGGWSGEIPASVAGIREAWQRFHEVADSLDLCESVR